ncbi:MAG: hypothetical protein GWN39_12860, partial [Thermoplasmata archaeon]|nr:right-handed parallel beta-helix repeat-containing protein [Thermoplasmata archaeon]NIS12941.1 right-handed parallel beta-helix repeat-containing protein [Thermoplasmata archaeon]NIS20849.1 right-handed parallel beta-helix repeat-containing protein [Thermoplasmata archaeon]NIT78267.1 right-handed parallel beta-helix repeat-containing protein [Thermoplasmata archaeon]NIU49908.1 right-handed parallel beta-helix repeat-containing protein [Thermoplasmata archaeon]
QPMQRGWYGIYFDLDMENVGYGWQYGLDLTGITSIQFQMYNRMYSCWIDGAYFDKTPRGDNITESANPTGDWAGYWSGFSTTSARAHVGSYSVSKYAGYSTNYFYYYWNYQNGRYADLSMYNAFKMYTYAPYGYAYLYEFRVYDANGRYAYWYTSSYTYFYYNWNYDGKWHTCNMPFDQSGTSYTYSGFDWSNIRYMRMYMRWYSSGTIYIDGAEFYYSQTAGKAGPPGLAEDIPHGIYALDDGELKITNSQFTSPEPWGAFVRSDSNLNVKSSSFDGLWGTVHPSIMNDGTTYGGILAFGGKTILDDVTITKASSSGIYVQNSDVTATGLDISGHSATYPLSAGMIVAFTNTQVGQTHTVSVSSSEFYNSPQGSGLMILGQHARGDATVDVDDVYSYRNQVYGVVTEVTGWTGNLTVSISNSEFEMNGGSGFTFNAHDAKVTPKTKVAFKVEASDAIENGAYGFLFRADKSHLNVDGHIEGLETYDNTGNGIGIEVGWLEGIMNLYFNDIFSHENMGNGMYIYFRQSQFRDFLGTTILPKGKLMVDMESCFMASNEGNGVYEVHNPAGSYQDIPTQNYEMIVKNTTIEKNNGQGWYVQPQGRPQYGSRFANYEFYNSVFSDNKGAGFYLRDQYYCYYYYGAEMEETFYFYNCTFTYNERGFRQYMDQYAYGDDVEIQFEACTFQDNDYEALYATGYWYSYYDSGMSYMKRVVYDVKDSLIDGYVYLHISGLYDQGGNVKPEGKISIVNSTYTYDEPMYLRIGSYYYSTSTPTMATVVYKGNTHTSPSIGNGIHIEMYGGSRLTGNIDIQDMDIFDPLGHGIYVKFGTLYRYTGSKSVSGKVNMVNVDIRNPLEDGVYIHTSHRQPSGGSSTGFYSLLNSRVQGANTGIKTFDFSGEIRNTRFSNLREETIYTYGGVIDVYESQVGPISEQNLRVDEKGAIRLWFELRVKVVWRDNPDQFVDGTTVEIKDNSWTILGVNSIDDMEGVLFTNLNSYTVLPEGIFTKNPYIVTADYIGIVKEQQVQIKENTEIIIKLVDDIRPRLTVESPADGHEQREQSITVKGTVYDKHTGVDR